jgi:hypothetical protein
MCSHIKFILQSPLPHIFIRSRNISSTKSVADLCLLEYHLFSITTWQSEIVNNTHVEVCFECEHYKVKYQSSVHIIVKYLNNLQFTICV